MTFIFSPLFRVFVIIFQTPVRRFSCCRLIIAVFCLRLMPMPDVEIMPRRVRYAFAAEPLAVLHAFRCPKITVSPPQTPTPPSSPPFSYYERRCATPGVCLPLGAHDDYASRGTPAMLAADVRCRPRLMAALSRAARCRRPAFFRFET